ncbi:universal stress protein UspA [Methyloprofundus sedimenti]|uniref:Universal stress protein UspA n=1 Tax=Methyloprofundus sedimenti TaxID=1420851 RepID=A0A1V8MAC4_9GAMM|nr:universal stress protein [Methyloprofundus sedimenti]OQK18519.1 universal stress protein UspA [Methyloprofundus sedimenti]
MNSSHLKHTQQLVLACIDGSAISSAVCDYSAWIAQRVNAPLKLLHNIEHQETPVVSDLTGNIGLGSQEHLLEELTQLEQQRSKLLMQKGKLILEAAKERVQLAGISDPITAKRHGSVVESLIDLEDNIRVLVLGVRGEDHEKQKGKIGSHLEMMIRAIRRPILVVNTDFKKPDTIMLAYDGSEAAEKAVDMVAISPLYKGLTCHLVCVSNIAEELIQQATEKLKKTVDLNLITAALKGKAEQELCIYQENHNIDLTIMGAFSHTRLHEILLGSFTVKMLLKTKKPLLLLR